MHGPEIIELLRRHLETMRSQSPPGSVHALDLDGLRKPEITLWSARLNNTLVGCGALKVIDAEHGEIKSMHTAAESRGSGVATALLCHILDEARARSYTRVSLETGSMDSFAAARMLYERHGFEYCPPFADYFDDPASVCMTLAL